MFTEKLSHSESWYAILVKQGKETRIKERFQELKQQLDIKDFVVPEPPEIKTKDEELGERYKDLLGYVLIKIVLNIERYNALLQLDNVYRFLGTICGGSIYSQYASYLPSCIPEKQVYNVRRYLSGECQPTCIVNKFSLGDEVEIMTGDLATIKGKIIQLSDNYAYITPREIFSQIIKVPIEKLSACM